MHQRTTGLVVGLVIFVILTVALLSTTIYFYVESERAGVSAKNSADEKRLATTKQRETEDAYANLVGFVTGDPQAARPSTGSDPLDTVKRHLGLAGDGKPAVKDVPNLKDYLATLRGNIDTLTADNESLKKQTASAQADAKSARQEADQARAAAQMAAKNVDEALGTLRSNTETYNTKVTETISQLDRAKDELENQNRNTVANLQGQIDQLSERNAEQMTRIEEMQTVMDKVRVKPTNPAQLVDGRVVDVGGVEGELFINLGSKQRLQPGMVFDVYDDAAQIQYDPDSGIVVPGKARIEVLKVSENTSTARVIPDQRGVRTGTKLPVVKDDVIANPLYSPDYRYKFLVHGKFDVNADGRATEGEADYVRRQIATWGGDVVQGNNLRGDLDFVVMGVQPIKPAPMAPNTDEAAYTQYFEARNAYDAYQRLFQSARESRVPVLNWNGAQVLTNEGR